IFIEELRFRGGLQRGGGLGGLDDRLLAYRAAGNEKPSSCNERKRGRGRQNRSMPLRRLNWPLFKQRLTLRTHQIFESSSRSEASQRRGEAGQSRRLRSGDACKRDLTRRLTRCDTILIVFRA